jgi:hypothetical protein
MKDLTPQQACSRLKKIFPDHYCSVTISAIYYSSTLGSEYGKTIYVQDVLPHKTGKSFRELLEGVE